MIRRLPASSRREMLDWEAPTGGYLLQASFATGAAAGRGVLKWLETGDPIGLSEFPASCYRRPNVRRLPWVMASLSFQFDLPNAEERRSMAVPCVCADLTTTMPLPMEASSR